MNIEECYIQLEGDYADVSSRLPSPKLIEKFIGVFLEDKSFETLCRQIECGNRDGAFCAAHTLKGICANLSFTRLLNSTARLTEELRPKTSSVSDTVIGLFKNVEYDYKVTADAIRTYFGKSE